MDHITHFIWSTVRKKLTRRTRNIGEWGVAVADKGMEAKIIYSFGSLWKKAVQQLIFHANKWINKHVHMFLVIYYYCVAHKVCWRGVTVEIEKAVVLFYGYGPHIVVLDIILSF